MKKAWGIIWRVLVGLLSTPLVIAALMLVALVAQGGMAIIGFIFYGIIGRTISPELFSLKGFQDMAFTGGVIFLLAFFGTVMIRWALKLGKRGEADRYVSGSR